MQFISYLFSPIPVSVFHYSFYLIIYSIALIVIAIAMKIIIAKKSSKALRRVYRNMPSHFIWIALTLIILIESRTNAIPYLSMRFLLYIVILISIYLVAINIYRFFTKYPKVKNIIKTKPNKQENKHHYSTSKKK
ncbi:hypothetical protein J7J83_02430 [bacterium]|nr:hypothetical protein [bacterium]